MKLREAIQILKSYNKWRRGADTPQPDPKLIGKAIDRIIKELEK